MSILFIAFYCFIRDLHFLSSPNNNMDPSLHRSVDLLMMTYHDNIYHSYTDETMYN